MSCAGCHRCDGHVVEAACGHCWHLECLYARVTDWHIPCPLCGQHLCVAYEDRDAWYIAADVKASGVVSLFRVGPDAKVERRLTHWPKTVRLQKRCLKTNICVS